MKRSTEKIPVKTAFISPHPDDETLGCGGTILRHHSGGRSIHWIIVTGMTESQGFSPVLIEKRQNEIDTIAGIYGFTAVHNLNLPTTLLDTIPMGELSLKSVHCLMRSNRTLSIFPTDRMFTPITGLFLTRPGVAVRHFVIRLSIGFSCTKPFQKQTTYPRFPRLLSSQ